MKIGYPKGDNYKLVLASLQPCQRAFIECLTTCSDDDLLIHLRAFTQWVWEKSDVICWASVLNRFDDIFSHYIKFSRDYIKGECEVDDESYFKEVELVKSALRTSIMIVENCGSKSTYNSVDLLVHLLDDLNLEIVYLSTRMLCVCFSIRNLRNSVLKEIPSVSQRLSTFVANPLPDRNLKIKSSNPTKYSRKFNQGPDSEFSVSCPLVLEYYIKSHQYWVSKESEIKIELYNKYQDNMIHYYKIPVREILNLESLSQNESNEKFVNYSSNEKFVSRANSIIHSIDDNQLYLHILKTFKYLVSKKLIDEKDYSLICMLLINTAFYTQFLTHNPCFLLELSWFIKCHEYIDYSTMIVSTELLSAMIYDGIQYKTLSNLLGFGVPHGIYVKVLKSYLHHEYESEPLPPILKMKWPEQSESSTAASKDFDYRTKDEKEICMLQPRGYVCENLEDDIDWKSLVQNPETRERILHDEERMRVLLQLLVVYYSIINYHGSCSALTSLNVLEMLVRFTRCRNPIYTPVIIYVVQVLEALLDYNQTVSRLLRTELHLYHVYISRIQFDMCKVEKSLHFGSELCNKNSWPNGWILPKTNDEQELRVYWLSFSEFSARKFLFKSIIKDIYLATRPYSGRGEINDYDLFAPTSPMVPIFLEILKNPLSYGHGVYSTVISLVLDTIRDDPVSQEEMHNLGIIPALLNSINEDTLKSEDSLNLVPTAISDLFLHRTAQEYYKTMKYSFVLRLIDVVVKRDFVLFHMFGEVAASIGLSLCTVVKHHETAHSLFIKRLIKVIYNLLLDALTYPKFRPISRYVSKIETDEYLAQFRTKSPPMTLETLSLLDKVKPSDFYADRIANLGKCLSTFLSLKQSVSQFISCDGIKLLMQLCTVPCLPPMFPQIYPQHPLVLIIKYLTSQAAIPSIIHFHTISQHYLNTNETHDILVNHKSVDITRPIDIVDVISYVDSGLAEDWKRLYMTYHFLYMIHKDNFSLYYTGCAGAYQLSVEFENLSTCELHNTLTMCLNTLIKEYPRLLFELSTKIRDDSALMAANSYLGHEHPQIRAYKQYTSDKKNEQNDLIFSANDLFWSTQCSYAYSTDVTVENEVTGKVQMDKCEELLGLEFCRLMIGMSKSLLLSLNMSINEAVGMINNGNECLKTYICKHSHQIVSLFFSVFNNLNDITASNSSTSSLEYFRNIRYISDVLELVYKLLIDDRTSGFYVLTACLFSSSGGMKLVCTCFEYVSTLLMAIVFSMALKLNNELTMKELLGTKLELGSFPNIVGLMSDFKNLEFSVLRNLYNPTIKCLQIFLSLFSRCTNPRTILNTNIDSNVVNLLSKYNKLYFSGSEKETQSLDEKCNIGRLFNKMILTCVKSCWSWFGFLVHMEPCTPSSSTSNPFFYIPTKILTLLIKVHIYYLDYLSPSRQQALNLHFANSVTSTTQNANSEVSPGITVARRSRARPRMVVSTSDDNFGMYPEGDPQDIESVRSYLSEMGFNEREINNAISHCGTSDIPTLTDWLVSVGELTPENVEVANYSQVPEDEHVNQKILDHLNSSYLLHLNNADFDTKMDTGPDLNLNNTSSNLQLDGSDSDSTQFNDLQLNNYEDEDCVKLMNELFSELKTQIIPYILKLAHLTPTFLQTAYDSLFKLHSFKAKFFLCVDSAEGDDVLKMFPHYEKNYETDFNLLNLMNFLMSKVIKLNKILQAKSLNVKNEHLLSLFSPLIFIYENEKQLALEQLLDKFSKPNNGNITEILEQNKDQDDMMYNYVLGVEHEHLLCYFYLLSHFMAGKENYAHLSLKLRDLNTGRPINILNQVLEIIDFFINLRSQCFSKGILTASTLGLKRKFGLSIPIPEWCLSGETESWFIKRESTGKFEYNSLKYGLYATKCVPQISSPPPFFKYALICVHEILKTRIIEGLPTHELILNSPSASVEPTNSQLNQKGSPVRNILNMNSSFSLDTTNSQSDRGVSSQSSGSELNKHKLTKDKEIKESPNKLYKESLRYYKDYEIPETVQEKLMYSCMKVLEMFPGSDKDVTFSLLSILDTITVSYKNAEKLVKFKSTVNKSTMDFLKILLTIPRSGLCVGSLKMVSHIILHVMEDYSTLKIALKNKIIQLLLQGPISFDRLVDEINVYYKKCPMILIQLLDSLCVITVDESLYPNGNISSESLLNDINQNENPNSEKQVIENTLINSENKVYKVKDLFISLKNHDLVKDMVSFDESDFTVSDTSEYKLDKKRLFQILKTIIEFLHMASNLQGITYSEKDLTIKDSQHLPINLKVKSDRMQYPYSFDLNSYFFLFNLINHNFPLPLLYPEMVSTLPPEIQLKTFPYKLDKLDKYNVRSLLIYVTRNIFDMICSLVIPSNMSMQITDLSFDLVQKIITDSLDNYSTALMLFSSKNVETCTCVIEEIAHVLHYISGLNTSETGPYFVPIAVYTLCNLLNNLLLLRFKKCFDLTEVLSKLKRVLCQIIGKLEIPRNETRIVCLSITRVLVLLTASGTASFGRSVGSERVNHYGERNGDSDLSEGEEDETALVVELEESDEDNMDMDSHESDEDIDEMDEMEESEEIEESDTGTNSGDMLIDVDSSGEETGESSDSENVMDDVEVSDDEANEEVALPHEVEEDYNSNQYSETVTTSSIEDLEEEEEDDGPRIRVAGEIDETSRNEHSQIIDTTTNISIPEDNESDSSIDEFQADFTVNTDNPNSSNMNNIINNNNIRISDRSDVQNGLDGHSIQIEIQLTNNQNLSIIDPSGALFGLNQPVSATNSFNNATSDRISNDRVISFNTFGNINLNNNNQRDSNTYRVDLGNQRNQGVDQRVDQGARGDTWSNVGDLDLFLKNPVLPQFKKSSNYEPYDPMHPLYLLILKKLKIIKVNSNQPEENIQEDIEKGEQSIQEDIEIVDQNMQQDTEVTEQSTQQIPTTEQPTEPTENASNNTVSETQQSNRQEIDSEGRYYNRALEVIANALGITYGDLFTLANMDPGVIAELPEDIREEIIVHQLNTITVDAVATVRQSRLSSGERTTTPLQAEGENLRIDMQYLESLPRSLRLDVTRALYGENSTAANEINASLDLEADHSSLLAALGPFFRSEGFGSVNDFLNNLASSLGQNSDDNVHPILFEAVRSRLEIPTNANSNNSSTSNNTRNTVNTHSTNVNPNNNMSNRGIDLDSRYFSSEGLILPLSEDGGIGGPPIAVVRDLNRNTTNQRPLNASEGETGRTGLTLGFIIGEVSRQNNINRRINRPSLGSINRNSMSLINRNSVNPVNRTSIGGINVNTINSVNRPALNSLNRNTLNASNRSGLNPVGRSTMNPINRGTVNGIIRGGRLELTDEMFLMPGRGFRMARLNEPLNQISFSGPETLGLDSVDDRHSLDARLLQTIPQILNSIDPTMFELFPQRVNQNENNDVLLNENCDSILENIIKLIPKSICSTQTKSTNTISSQSKSTTNGTTQPTVSNVDTDDSNADQIDKSIGMMGCGGDMDTTSLLSICKMFFLPVEMNKRIFFKLLHNISLGPSQGDLMKMLLYILKEAILGVDTEYECPDIDETFFRNMPKSHFSNHSDWVNRTKVSLEPNFTNSIMTVFDSKVTIDYYNFSYICSERVLEQLRSILIALPTTIITLSRPIFHSVETSVHDLKRKKKRFGSLITNLSDIANVSVAVCNPIDLLFYATATNLFQSSVKHMNHLLMLIHNLIVYRSGVNFNGLDDGILPNVIDRPTISENEHSEILESLSEEALGAFLRIYTSFTCQSTWLQMCNTKDANAQTQLEVISQIISVLLKGKHRHFVIEGLTEKFQLISSLLSERLSNLTGSIVFDYQIEPLIHTLLRITQLVNSINIRVSDNDDIVQPNDSVGFEFFRKMDSGTLETLWNRLDECLVYLTEESMARNFTGDFYKETHIENQHYFDMLRSLIPLIEVLFIISQLFIAHDYGVPDLKFDIILANLNYESFYNYQNLSSTSSNRKFSNDMSQSYFNKMSQSDFKMGQSDFGRMSNLADDEDMIEISENHLLMMNFVEKHKRLLNLFIKQTPSLLNGTFMPMIRLTPMCLSFDIKRQYFRQKLREGRVGLRIDPIKINVRRQHVFLDSYHQLRLKTSDEMKGKLSVSFGGEEGVDAGGLTREWYTILSKEFFNPNYALFTREGRKQEFNHPNPLSAINPDHLNYFKFIGRVIGKALYDGHHMEAYFCRSFYKHMLGSRITPCDAESVDPQFYNNLISIRNCSLEQLGLELYFSTEIDEFGKVKIIDLVPNGRNILVTDENKHKYIQLLCRHKVTNGIKEQLDAFMQGFRELISPELISIFDDRELELLISGIPIIDLENMKQNVEYINYTEESLQIIWLWEILSEFDQSHLAAFLQFVTGTSRVPIGGFKNLMGMRGPQKISIHKTFGQDRLPTAHTCFNQLDLPCYPSREMLKSKLLQAILEGKEGFGFM
uniref:HECT-type E3 ubiquitin transferase n=1 Tax=Theileria annulata TaxID=5874 RepID=A0A3B0MHT7_THEAN